MFYQAMAMNRERLDLARLPGNGLPEKMRHYANYKIRAARLGESLGFICEYAPGSESGRYIAFGGDYFLAISLLGAPYQTMASFCFYPYRQIQALDKKLSGNYVVRYYPGHFNKLSLIRGSEASLPLFLQTAASWGVPVIKKQMINDLAMILGCIAMLALVIWLFTLLLP